MNIEVNVEKPHIYLVIHVVFWCTLRVLLFDKHNKHMKII